MDIPLNLVDMMVTPTGKMGTMSQLESTLVQFAEVHGKLWGAAYDGMS